MLPKRWNSEKTRGRAKAVLVPGHEEETKEGSYFFNSHRERKKKRKVGESDVVGWGEDPRGDRMGGNLCVA